MSFTVHDKDGNASQITQVRRGSKSAMLMDSKGSQTGGIIVDTTAGTMTMVNTAEKSYTVIPLGPMQQMMSGMAESMKNMTKSTPDDDTKPKGTLTATGQSETVAGVKCQVYTFEGTENGKHVTGEACLAKGAGLMAGADAGGMLPGQMGARQRASMQKRLTEMGPIGTLLAQGYGIMKATTNEDGKFNGSMEVTAYQPGVAPESAFQPPAGYTKKDMPGMMGKPE
ncbi:MAG: DUF4412 domain-containing protein [Gemmatimonadaceae bacterium]